MVDGLRQAITEAVVGKAVVRKRIVERDQPVGMVVAVGTLAIGQ